MSERQREEGRPEPEEAAEADIEIGAAARARKLRFRSKPETEVTFPGSDQERSGSHTDRENLPDEVEPGVDYKDVKVRWRAGAHLSGRIDELTARRMKDEPGD